MKKEYIRRIIFWTSVCVSVLMVVLICIELYQNVKAENDFEKLRDLVNKSTIESSTEPTTELVTEPPTTTTTPEPTTEPIKESETTPEPTTTPEPETTTEAREILEQYREIHELNNHMVGWIKIPGTVVDYPVLEVEGDNDFYLKKDFYGEYSRHGQIIFDYRCDYAKPSTNIILHGHHMADGSMFACLMSYKKEQFYRNHRYIEFDTLYEEGKYEVFAVFLSRVYNTGDDVFKYYNFIDANSEEEFNEYIENVKALALYDTGITPVYGDEIITLSTCDYTQKDTDNGRCVLVARRVK